MFNEIVTPTSPEMPILIKKRRPSRRSLWMQMHFHDEIELVSVYEGKLAVRVEEKEIILTKGDSVFINHRVPHTTKNMVTGTVSVLLQFEPEKIRITEYEHMNKYLTVLIGDEDYKYFCFDGAGELGKQIFYYLDSINNEAEEKGTHYNTFIRGYLFLLTGSLYRSRILSDVKSKYISGEIEKILPCLKYIEENYNKQITLSELSEILHINQNYLCRLFKGATNSTVMEYINFVRIWKAENLLTTTSDSVLDISMEVGFSSISYFNRVFKKLKNTTPTVYRQYSKNNI